MTRRPWKSDRTERAEELDVAHSLLRSLLPGLPAPVAFERQRERAFTFLALADVRRRARSARKAHTTTPALLAQLSEVEREFRAQEQRHADLLEALAA